MMINLITGILLLVTTGLQLLAKMASGDKIVLNWTTGSQLLSLWGTVLLCWSFCLSSRGRWMETVFGGQDKIIKKHQWLGGLSFFMLLHHPIFLAVNALPFFDQSAKYLFFSSNLTYNLGVMGLYTMILMLILTLLVNLPYELWLKTHDLLWATLWFGGAHIYMIESDVSRYLPLRIWIFAWLFVGVYAFVYKVFLYKWLGPRFIYKVFKVINKGDVVEVLLQSTDKNKLTFNPGQFVYVQFDGETKNERHPFSISSSPKDEFVRLSIKILGDYTLKLKKMAEGTKVLVWGPYGRLGFDFGEDKNIVMVAGGIGITPFLSMVRNELVDPKNRKLKLFYSAKNDTEMVYRDEIEDIANKIDNLELISRNSVEVPRFTGKDILEKVEKGFKTKFYLCGPRQMMEDITNQLVNLGIKRKNIIFEDFSFKI